LADSVRRTVPRKASAAARIKAALPPLDGHRDAIKVLGASAVGTVGEPLGIGDRPP
jgi:hypothetical protein